MILKMKHLDTISIEERILAIRHLKSLRISIDNYNVYYGAKLKLELREDARIEKELSSIVTV